MNHNNLTLAHEAWSDVVMHQERGLSTGPAQRLSRRASRFDCEIVIETIEGRKANAKDLLSLLLLGAPPGAHLRVRCRGPRAVTALEAMVESLVSAGEVDA